LQLSERTWSRLLRSLAFSLISTFAAGADAETVDTNLRATMFYEPSAESRLVVLTPAFDLGVHPTDWLEISAGYEADIVSGATEAIKSGELADIVSAATEFDDFRHVVHGAVAVERESTSLSVGYSYGTESDYRSQAFNVAVGTDFFQKNTEIELSYARGFDSVCTTAYASNLAPSARLRLDGAEGCFTSNEDRAERAVNLDTLQAAWTQAWTPVLSTQLVLTGSIQNGFLENPYRGVVIAPAGDEALENHPDNRARAAAAVRGRYFIKPLDGAVGASARLYRDTWDIIGQTYELEAEKYLTPAARIRIHGRYYTQTGALFWSDDYTGGEPETGPRGQYWTGDRELSPLSSFLLGARVLIKKEGTKDARLLGILLAFQASAGIDFLKTNLEEFTWGGRTPDDTLAAIASFALRGEF
jgi:hypothetical protein